MRYRLNTLWIYTALKQSFPKMRTLFLFEYPLDLHCSQTTGDAEKLKDRLNTLWIYTALKRGPQLLPPDCCLNTLWIYTALKHTI